MGQAIEQSTLKVYADGSTFPNPGRGGWAWVTLDGREGFGSAENTTNQRMELTAVIEAVKALWHPERTLLVVSDSQYVIKGATIWWKGWVRNGWCNYKGQPVANKDLWLELFDIAMKNVEYEWVKGHSGDPGNEAADRLATKASGATKELIQKCERQWRFAR